MRLTWTNRNKCIFWGILLYRLIIDLAYPSIAHDFRYMGFQYTPITMKIVVSYLLLILLSILCLWTVDLDNNSELLLFILFLMAYIPNTMGYAIMGFSDRFIALATIFWSEIWIINGSKWSYSIKRVTRINKTKSDALLVYYPLFVALFLMGYSFFYNGFRLSLDFSDVYSLRAAYVQKRYGAIMERVIPWSANITLPLAAIYAIKHKRYYLLIPYTIAAIAVFSLAGMKTYIVIYAISLVAAFVYKDGSKIKFLPYFFAGIGFLCLVLGALNSEIINNITNYFFRRILYTTTYNNNGYIEFFSSNEKMLLRCSFLKILGVFGVEIPYGGDINSYIAGFIYPLGNNGSVPSGTFADAYGNFGVWGVLIYPFLYVWIVRLLDPISRKIPRSYILPVIVSTAEYMLNGSLFTVILSYGFIYSLVYYYFIGKYTQNFGDN